ncbi:hypothetical protein [Wenzhouxiangella sp. XN24]|uniref:hypothetical protein n=1 Tax=Wenzhouxiangella sp. XN24 TaxID=2713569 RepID=UPI0013ED9A1E|nr:hypothetical protein [Wenzhouxiangella sp. XN24]NGX16144.1 hypothetical protein [Wenzhouxiangella sp. XN24]
MKIFSSLASLDAIRGSLLSPALKGIVVRMLGHFEYDPQEDGYVVLIEEGDLYRDLADLCLPYRLCEVPFEAVHMTEGHYCAIYLANNQFAITFLIPDADWVQGELRKHLESLVD